MSPSIENSSVRPSGATSRSSHVPSSVVKRTVFVGPWSALTSQAGASAAMPWNEARARAVATARRAWRMRGFPCGEAPRVAAARGHGACRSFVRPPSRPCLLPRRRTQSRRTPGRRPNLAARASRRAAAAARMASRPGTSAPCHALISSSVLPQPRHSSASSRQHSRTQGEAGLAYVSAPASRGLTGSGGCSRARRVALRRRRAAPRERQRGRAGRRRCGAPNGARCARHCRGPMR